MKELWDTIPTLHIRKWKDSDVIMMFKIAYWCQLRPIEYINLNADSFDIENNELYLGKTKTTKEDVTIIPPLFREELRQYLIDKQGPLLPGLSYYTVYSWLIKLGKKLDIPAFLSKESETGEKTKGHIFRKSMPKDLIYGKHGNKPPINVISKGLRHKGKNPIASTYHYLKLDNEDLKDWWEQNSNQKETVDEPITKSEEIDLN